MISQDEIVLKAVRSIDRIPACASCNGLHDREWEDHGQGVGTTIDHSSWAWQNAKRCDSCAIAVADHVIQAETEKRLRIP